MANWKKGTYKLLRSNGKKCDGHEIRLGAALLFKA